MQAGEIGGGAMIVAISAPQGSKDAAHLAANLAVLRVRSRRKVLLIDTDASAPLCQWSRERRLAGRRPFVPAKKLFGLGLACQLEAMLALCDDSVINIGSVDGPEARSALIASQLAVVVDKCLSESPQQDPLLAGLTCARQFNPGLKILFVRAGELASSAESAAAMRTSLAPLLGARLAATVLVSDASQAYGAGGCLWDGPVRDPASAAQLHALYLEIFGQPALTC